MCEAVEKYGDRRARIAESRANVNFVKKLMDEMKMTLDQALDFLGLDCNQRAIVTKQLQK